MAFVSRLLGAAMLSRVSQGTVQTTIDALSLLRSMRGGLFYEIWSDRLLQATGMQCTPDGSVHLGQLLAPAVKVYVPVSAVDCAFRTFPVWV